MTFRFIPTAVITLLLVVASVTAKASSVATDTWARLLTEEQRQTTVNIHLNNASVQDVFQILADQLDLNLIIDDGIEGQSNLKLNEVNWVDAVNSLAKSHNVFLHLTNNVLWVTRQPQDATAQSGLAIELIPVNFARAVELAELLNTNHQGLLSEHGSLSVDERTNTLLINDTANHVNRVRSLIAKLDKPVKQVMIEARMVSLKTNIAQEFGVRWGASSTGLTNPETEPSMFIKGMRLELPTTQPAATVGLNVARLSDDLLLDLELTALEQENKGNIIASPKIFTANQQPAYIEQGTEIPYVESAASGATAVQFKKAVMGLRVTPQITPNDHVLLDLTITQNTRGDTVSTPTGPAVAIDTQEMGTQVLVKNGETIVLGGIFQTLELNDDRGVPILSSLPVVGHLFKHQQQQRQKRELVIFVTPTILTGSE
jgi:type IV pilus assembly protein PilQ